MRRFAQISGTTESLWDTGKRLDSDYRSEGWEFESLRARSLPATRFSGAVVASVRNQVGRVVFFVSADTSWGSRS